MKKTSERDVYNCSGGRTMMLQKSLHMFMAIAVAMLVFTSLIPKRALALEEEVEPPGAIDVVEACGSQRWDDEIFESYVRDTLPNEWVPSWPEQSLKAGAILVRTVGWEHQRASGGDITTQNNMPNCAARQNFVKDSQFPPGRAGTNSAVNNTFGLYIPDGGEVRYINYNSTKQHITHYAADNCGVEFIGAIMYAYSTNPDTDPPCGEGTTWNFAYRVAPLTSKNPTQYGNETSPCTPFSSRFHCEIWMPYTYNGHQGEEVGQPFNNGGSEWVHRWDGTDPTKRGWVQDFKGGSSGQGIIMCSDAEPRCSDTNPDNVAYWVHGSIFLKYLENEGGPGWLGYPRSNEYPWSGGDCGFPRPRSDFYHGYITWSCNNGGWWAYPPDW